MNIFEYVVAILMLILGLGVTALLGDVVDAFRNRHKTRLHWIPLIWAAIVFIEQMQFLWAIFELNYLIQSWTAEEFIVMLCLALLLFVAGSLVVPRGDHDGMDSWELFQQNGRWSLAVLACYQLIAFIVNPLFFDIPIFDLHNLPNLLLGIFLITLLFIQNRKARAWGTVAYSVLIVSVIALLSPAADR